MQALWQLEGPIWVSALEHTMPLLMWSLISEQGKDRLTSPCSPYLWHAELQLITAMVTFPLKCLHFPLSSLELNNCILTFALLRLLL
jgi:hypothetical protein